MIYDNEVNKLPTRKYQYYILRQFSLIEMSETNLYKWST